MADIRETNCDCIDDNAIEITFIELQGNPGSCATSSSFDSLRKSLSDIPKLSQVKPNRKARRAAKAKRRKFL